MMARKSRLTGMAYDEVSFVDKGANLDDDGVTGAHVVLYKRDTSELGKGDPGVDDVHTPSPLNGRGSFNRRGEQRKCRECGSFYDKDQGSCPECGAANMSQNRLMKALSDFFGAVDDIEKDEGTALLDDISEEEEVELTDEEIDSLNAYLATIEEDEEEDDSGNSNQGDEGATLHDKETDQQEEDMPGNGKPDLTDLDPAVRAYIEGLEAQVPKGVEKNDDDIFKSLDPAVAEVVRKAISDSDQAQQRLAKMEDEKETEQYRNVAKGFTHLTVEDKTGDALRALAKADNEAYEEVLRVLKSADTELAESSLFQTLGKSYTDVNDDIEKQAKDIAKADNITIEQARIKVYEANPRAYEDSLREGK